MSKLDRLPEYTESILYDLTAGQDLKQRILNTAADDSENKKRGLLFHPVPVLCSLVAVLLIVAVFINGLKPVVVPDEGQMMVFTAGGNQTEAPENISSFERVLYEIEPETIERIELDNNVTIYNDDKSCTELFRILKDKAVLDNGQILPESSVMTIVMKDGSSFQTEIYRPWLTDGKKVWICKDFFDKVNSITENK